MQHFLDDLLGSPINLIAFTVVSLVAVAAVVYIALRPKFFRLMLKNLGRNFIRTCLISVAIMVLVAMITLIWTVTYFLDQATRERAKDFKLIVTERWQLPSQLPFQHAAYLDPKSPAFLGRLKDDKGNLKYGPNDFMTWSFYGGSVTPTPKNPKDVVFFFAMQPDAIKPMMDDLENFDDKLIAKLKDVKNGCLLGRDRLFNLDKRVGERFKVYSFNYKGIDLEFEIVGELPEGRYNQSAIMRSDYFADAFNEYERKNGKPHPLQAPDDRRLNLIWIRVADRAAFDELGTILENAPEFSHRPIKVETASSGIGSFLEAWADLLYGIKYLLVPAILSIMALVVAIAISISIRERRSEIAVMKVLGFKPIQVMNLIVGESLVLGTVSGFLASAAMIVLINWTLGGLPIQIAFFPAFMIPYWALAWGPAMGALCALAGSFFPAQQARAVRVSEVFSRVA